jgi:hypothetical protein
MFFNGSASTGVCPAGDGHNAQGFNFVLRPGQICDLRLAHKPFNILLNILTLTN